MNGSAFIYSKAYARHAICDSCWKKREPARDAVRVREAGIEACCFCGVLSASGIFVRECSDPTQLRGAMFCRGHA